MKSSKHDLTWQTRSPSPSPSLPWVSLPTNRRASPDSMTCIHSHDPPHHRVKGETSSDLWCRCPGHFKDLSFFSPSVSRGTSLCFLAHSPKGCYSARTSSAGLVSHRYARLDHTFVTVSLEEYKYGSTFMPEKDRNRWNVRNATYKNPHGKSKEALYNDAKSNNGLAQSNSDLPGHIYEMSQNDEVVSQLKLSKSRLCQNYDFLS